MNKTISVNLGGRNFFIEEEAYKKLEAYLNGIKAHFVSYPGSGEIVADMESRIAEKFEAKYQEDPKAVITSADIDSLIAELGTVEDIAGEENTKGSHKSSSHFGKKRLMRDGDNVIIAGVASGIAAYFDLDPFIVRLIFGVLLIAWGAIVPIYILLWIIMPEAKSPTEKMQMRGEPLNLDSLSNTIKERAQEFSNHVKDMNEKQEWKKWGEGMKHTSKQTAEEMMRAGRKGGEGVGNFFRKLFSLIGNIILFVLKLITKIIGLGLIMGMGIAIAATTIAVAMAIFNSNSPYLGLPFSAIAHGTMYYILLILAYIIALIPLQAILLIGVSIFNGKKSLRPAAGFAMLGVWIIALSAGAVLGARYVPAYVEQVKNSPELQRVSKSYTDFSGYDKVNLGSSIKYKLVQGKEFGIKASGWAMDLERLDISLENGTLSVRENSRDFCFFCFSGSPEVEITAPQFNSIVLSNSSEIKDTTIKATSTSLSLHNSSEAAINFEVKELKLEITNSSVAKLEGVAEKLKASLKNSSSLRALSLKAKQADITAVNSSRAEVNVEEKLLYDTKNSSRVYYSGKPQVEGMSNNFSREPIQINDPYNIDF